MPKYNITFGRHISEPDYDWEENPIGNFEYDVIMTIQEDKTMAGDCHQGPGTYRRNLRSCPGRFF